MITDYDLIQELKTVKTETAVRKYVNKYLNTRQQESFHEYLREYITNNNLSMAQVMNNSRLNKNYGYNITNGTRKRPGREKVLALCIGADMSFDEVQKALYLAGQPLLDPRNERDVWIAFALNSHINDVLVLNIKLEELGLEPLQV